MKHIIRKILREEFNKTNLKKGYELKGSQWLFDFIRYEEGDPKQKGEPVLTSYKISGDKWTIGYGHTTGDVEPKVTPNMTITKEDAEKILSNDLTYSANCVRRIFKEQESKGIDVLITQNMFDVLTSLVFNSGCDTVRKSSFIQQLKDGDYSTAGEKIKGWNISYPGHVDRREKESQHFLS